MKNNSDEPKSTRSFTGRLAQYTYKIEVEDNGACKSLSTVQKGKKVSWLDEQLDIVTRDFAGKSTGRQDVSPVCSKITRMFQGRGLTIVSACALLP